MKIFISWSGPTSGAIAAQLRAWLPTVIQAVRPYYSPDDISKGTRWNDEVAKELEVAHIGLICLTADNLDRPWLLFEAGALSKNLDKSRVIPLLFGLTPTDIGFPLATFQVAQFNKIEMRKVMNTINNSLGDNALDNQVLNNVFEKFWPDLDAGVQEQLQKAQKIQEGQVRSERSLLEEILTLTREVAQSQVLNPRNLTIDMIRNLAIRFIEVVSVVQNQPASQPRLARQLLQLAESVENIVLGVDPFPLSGEEFNVLSKTTGSLQELPKQINLQRRHTAVIEEDEDLPF